MDPAQLRSFVVRHRRSIVDLSILVTFLLIATVLAYKITCSPMKIRRR
jgi:hypothetical protein